MVDRVIATPATLALIEVLKAKYGPHLFFHQSGGVLRQQRRQLLHRGGADHWPG